MSVNHTTMSGHRSRHSHDTEQSLLSIKEAAEVAGITERTINRLIASHEIQSMKSGKRRLIWRESLLTWKRHRRRRLSGHCPDMGHDVVKAIEELKELILKAIELYQPDSFRKLQHKHFAQESSREPK